MLSRVLKDFKYAREDERKKISDKVCDTLKDMLRDNVSDHDFELIDGIQLSNDNKKMLSDFIVNTNKPLNILRAELIRIIDLINGD